MITNEKYILQVLNQHVMDWADRNGVIKPVSGVNELPFNEESYPDELDVLIRHMDYSLSEITEYQELTEKEQKFIDKGNFEKMFLSPDEIYHQQLLDNARQKMSSILQNLLNEGLDEPDIQNLLNKLQADIPIL